MNKKEIYEHLANIYLDASSKSSKKKNRFNPSPKTTRGLFIAAVVLFVGAGSFTFYRAAHISAPSVTALFLHQDTAKINFNFDPAKKEVYSLDLKKLDLTKYKHLGFTVKKANSGDIISLRIEFTNNFNEKSEIYIKDISVNWKEHKIELSRFNRIKYWDKMKELAFSIEEWNAREKSGIVYLDNIRVLK